MTEYSNKFVSLKSLFDEINTYAPGTSVNIENVAKLFVLELMEVTTQYEVFQKRILNDKEYATVQKFINKITGNRNISKALRRRILEESLPFNEMVETINHTLVGL